MNPISPKFSGLIAAFDAGATNTRFCLVDDRKLSVVSTISKAATPDNRSDFERLIQASVRQLETDSGKTVDSVAMAIAGRVDPQKGQVLGVNNGAFSAKGKALGKSLAETLKKPVFLMNDAKAFALGEAVAGAGKNFKRMLGITIGTGIGSGLVINKQIDLGPNNTAGAIGHATVEMDGRPCKCGRQGCWETYASGTGLAATARQMLNQEEAGLAERFLALIGKTPDTVIGIDVIQAAAKGDEFAGKVLTRWQKHLAEGVANAINSFDPDVVVLGGGVAESIDYSGLRASVAGKLVRTLPRTDVLTEDQLAKTDIRPAALGDEAALIGVAAMAGLAGKH